MSSLRAFIRVFDAKGLEMSKEQKKSSFKMLLISELLVDPRYQRALKNKHKLYGKDWDHRAAGALIVARRPCGRYFLVDGLQRKTGAEDAGEEFMPCMVFDSDGGPEEAEVFMKCNIDRTSMSNVDKFWAGVEAGRTSNIEVHKGLLSIGCRVKRSGYEWDASLIPIGNVSNFLDAFKRGSLGKLLYVLKECLDRQQDKKKLLSSYIVGGINQFICDFADAGIDYNHLAKELSVFDVNLIATRADHYKARAGIYGNPGGGQSWVARAVSELYNKNLRGKNRRVYT